MWSKCFVLLLAVTQFYNVTSLNGRRSGRRWARPVIGINATESRLKRGLLPSELESAYLDRFLSNDEITDFLTLINKKYPEITKLDVIGSTYENRQIFVLKMSTDFSAGKPLAIIEGGLHAREWASPATLLHIITRLVGPDRAFLDDTDFYIVPVSNPDGYHYSHQQDRFWRKNRAPSSTGCIGTDLNRNFDVDFSHRGSSDNPCDITFPGSKAFSERETRALRDMAIKEKDRLASYVSVHAFGPLILYPWGFSKVPHPDAKLMHDCGIKAAEAIAAVRGTQFQVGNTATVIYESSGGSDDYMKATFGMTYAYTIELAGGGSQGFDYPESDIRNLVAESSNGVLTLAQCHLPIYRGKREEKSSDLELAYLDRFLWYDEITVFLGLMNLKNPDITQLEIIGNTYENRSIFLIKLSSNFSAGKPLAIIEGGVHAREWASPATLLHIITRLVGPDRAILDDTDFYIVPVSNPDGYHYSHKHNRLWRKNRAPSSGGCIGTDINRNFDIDFGNKGSSSNHCDENYHGPSAFSENESKALRDMTLKEKNRLTTYVSVHSFGPRIYYPWAYTKARSPDADVMSNCAQSAAQAIAKVRNTTFQVGNTATISSYEASGGADDYMKATFGLTYAYTVELAGGGSHGFEYPEDDIRFLVAESSNGVLTLAQCHLTIKGSRK